MPPSIALPTPSCAALDPAEDPVGVEGAEALARDRAAVEMKLGELVELRALWGAVVDASARRRTARRPGRGRWRRRRGELRLDHGVAEDPVGELADLGRRLLGLHPDRLRLHQAGFGTRLDQLLGDGHVDRLQVQELLERGDQRRQVHLVLVGDLLEQVVAADQVLGAVISERATTSFTSSPMAPKKRAQLVGGVGARRRELLQPVLLGLLRGLNLGGDADVTCVELAAATDRAAERDHRQGAEGDAVGAHAGAT